MEDVKQKWEAKKHYFEQYKKDGPRPPCIDLDMAILGFNIDNTAAYQAIEDQKLYMHVGGRPKKVCTVSRGEPCQMYETRLSRMIMQLPLAQMVTFCRDWLRFTAAFFTKTRVVKLRLRSPLSGITTVSLGCSGFNFSLTPLSLVSHAHTLFCPPFFPRRHLVTSIYSMAHGAVIDTFPVASRYRYIPNTLSRKRLR